DPVEEPGHVSTGEAREHAVQRRDAPVGQRDELAAAQTYVRAFGELDVERAARLADTRHRVRVLARRHREVVGRVDRMVAGRRGRDGCGADCGGADGREDNDGEREYRGPAESETVLHDSF